MDNPAFEPHLEMQPRAPTAPPPPPPPAGDGHHTQKQDVADALPQKVIIVIDSPKQGNKQTPIKRRLRSKTGTFNRNITESI